MWVSGVVRKRRHVALSDMVEAAVRADSFESPWSLTPSVWDHFPHEAAILEELQRDWRTALAGAVYVAIEAGDGDLQHDVMVAFEKMTRRYYGARKILEAHAEHPSIAAAMRKERALLASFTSLLAAA